VKSSVSLFCENYLDYDECFMFHDWATCATQCFHLSMMIMGVIRIGSSCTECQLRVGDRILEVNGIPVHDHELPDIENTLNYRNSVVQVRFRVFISMKPKF